MELSIASRYKSAVFSLCVSVCVFGVGFYTVSYDAMMKDRFIFDLKDRTTHLIVMDACNKGAAFGKYDSPQLVRFSKRKLASFNCRTLHKVDKAEDIPDQEFIENFAIRHLYLIKTVSFLWKATGITWHTFYAFIAVLIGCISLLIYKTYMTFLPRALAFIAWMLTIISPINYVITFRDFSKYLFFAFSIYCLSRIVLNKNSQPTNIMILVALGSAIGIGWGFRADVLILLPVIALLVAFYIDGGLNTRNFKTKLVYLFALFVPVYLLSRPISAPPANTWSHISLLGFGSEPTEELGLSSESYNFSLDSWDDPVKELVGNYEYRIGKKPSFQYTSEYAKSAQALLHEFYTVFPADLVLRGLSSIEKTLALPARAGSKEIHVFPFDTSYGIKIEQGVFRIWNEVAKGYLIYLVLALVILSFYSTKSYLWALFVICYFMAYPGLYFLERHLVSHFFLANLVLVGSLFTIGVHLAKAVSLLGSTGLRNFQLRQSLTALKPSKRQIVTVLLPVITTAGVLLLLRFSQDHAIKEMIRDEILPTTAYEIPYQAIRQQSGMTALQLDDARLFNPLPFFKLEFQKSCDRGQPARGRRHAWIKQSFGYEKTTYGRSKPQLPREPNVSISLWPQGASTIVVPVNATRGKVSFLLPDSDYRCLKGIYQLENRASPKLRFGIRLKEDWRSQNFYLSGEP